MCKCENSGEAKSNKEREEKATCFFPPPSSFFFLLFFFSLSKFSKMKKGPLNLGVLRKPINTTASSSVASYRIGKDAIVNLDIVLAFASVKELVGANPSKESKPGYRVCSMSFIYMNRQRVEGKGRMSTALLPSLPSFSSPFPSTTLERLGCVHKEGREH